MDVTFPSILWNTFTCVDFLKNFWAEVYTSCLWKIFKFVFSIKMITIFLDCSLHKNKDGTILEKMFDLNFLHRLNGGKSNNLAEQRLCEMTNPRPYFCNMREGYAFILSLSSVVMLFTFGPTYGINSRYYGVLQSWKLLPLFFITENRTGHNCRFHNSHHNDTSLKYGLFESEARMYSWLRLVLLGIH